MKKNETNAYLQYVKENGKRNGNPTRTDLNATVKPSKAYVRILNFYIPCKT